MSNLERQFEATSITILDGTGNVFGAENQAVFLLNTYPFNERILLR
jgi:hypothetical protein